MRFPTLVRNGQERPIVAVTVSVPGQHPVLFDALVDTGADISLFPQSVADRLGLDLSQQPDVIVFAAIGGQCQYRLHEVELELRRSPDTFRWKGSVGFVGREMSYAILGTRGFFQFFDLNYSNSRQTIDIISAGDLPV